MAKYRHVLALNPYFGSSTAALGVFPPTGLEYIAANMKDLVGKVTLLDLRYEKAYQDLETLSRFIRAEIDLLCISIQWDAQFENICDFISQLPDEVPTVVGGYQATLEVEEVFKRCPNVDMVVRGEGEEIIRRIVSGCASPGDPRALLSGQREYRAQREPAAARPRGAGLSGPLPERTRLLLVAAGRSAQPPHVRHRADDSRLSVQMQVLHLQPQSARAEAKLYGAADRIGHRGAQNDYRRHRALQRRQHVHEPQAQRAALRPDHRERDQEDVRRPGPRGYRQAPQDPRQGPAGGIQESS